VSFRALFPQSRPQKMYRKTKTIYDPEIITFEYVEQV